MTHPDDNGLAQSAQPMQKRHRIFDHRVLTCLSVFIYSLLCQVVFTLLALGVAYAAGIDMRAENELFAGSVRVVSALLVCVVFELRFRGEFDGMFGPCGKGLLLILPALLFTWGNVYDLVDLIGEGGQPNSIAASLCMALAPGLGEEILFRGVPACNWMRLARDESDIVKCTLCTSLLFGMVHGLNALSGAALSSSVFQMFYATCLGMLFCAVLLRCGSIWPSIITHVFIDLTAFLGTDLSHAGLLTEGLTIDLAFFVTVTTAVAVAAWGLYLIRPERRPEIMALWEKKWRVAE